MTLHRTLGNQAVQRLFQSGVIQPKLTIGKPDDRYEQEADHVAEQVMNSGVEQRQSGVRSQEWGLKGGGGIIQTRPGRPSGATPSGGEKEVVQTKPLAVQITPVVQRQTEEESEADEEEEVVQEKTLDPSLVQRQEDEEEEEEETAEPVQAKQVSEQIKPLVQRQEEDEEEEEEEEEETVQTKGSRGASPSLSRDQEFGLRYRSGQGNPLPESIRAMFEPRFGRDFSEVRIHTDGQAAGVAHAIHAQAFTHGRDIYFGAGRYQPQSSEGRRLLAHELVHVCQQKRGQISTANLVQRAPNDKTGDQGVSGVESPYDEEQQVIRYAIGARELGKLAKGTILYHTRSWKAYALSDSAFYVGPFMSDMGNFYYVYRFTGSEQKTSTYTLARSTYLPGPDTKDLQASLAQVQGGKTLKVKTTGLIPPSGGAVEKSLKKGAESGGAEKGGAKGATMSEGTIEAEELTPQRRKWLTAGRENMKHQIIALFNEIQKVKAARIDSWEKNANIKDPKPVKAALEIAVEIVGYGIGGVVGGFLTKAMAHGLAQEFAKEALLKSTVKLAEGIFEHAVEPAEEFLAEETRKALNESGDGNAAFALATKTNLLDCYAEAVKLQSISEEHVQTREFNASVDTKYTDLALADTVLVFEKLYNILFNEPKAFLRELSEGLIRLKDEMYVEEKAKKYGGDVAKMLKEDPTIHETAERSGNLLMVPDMMPGANQIGYWHSPTFNFNGFVGLSTGLNKAILMELRGTRVNDLPFTLGFRFWGVNPFSGLFVDPLCQVWFERRPDGRIWVDLDEPRNSDGFEWLASYFLLTSRELTETEREKYAPEGARKVYEHIKDKPLNRGESMDIF